MTNNISNLDLLELSSQAYNGNNASSQPLQDNPQYQKIDIDLKDFSNDFSATAYYDQANNKLIISYAGTDDLQDLFVNDPGYVAGYRIPQFENAVNFYQQAVTKVNQMGNAITKDDTLLTGHSHGGGLAQMVGVLYDVQARVFNAPGISRQLDNIESYLGDDSIGAGQLTSRDLSSFKVVNTYLKSDIVHLAGDQIGEKVELDASTSILGTVVYALSGFAGAALLSNPITGTGAGLLAKFLGSGASNNHMISGLKEALENQQKINSGQAQETTVAKFLNAIESIDLYIERGISSVTNTVNKAIDWMTSGHVAEDLTGAARDAWNSTVSFFEGLFDGHSGAAPTNSDGTVNTGAINNSLLNLTVTTSPLSSNATANPNSFINGTVKSGGDYSIDMPSTVLNQDGLNNQEASKITSDQERPGAQTLTDNTNSSWIDRTANFLQQNFVQPIADLGSSVWSGIQSAFSSITNLFSNAFNTQNVDPLVLDLNGNGVELISFENSKVSFDVDNDGFKENTGWVKGTDGILVEDKNHNGKIDDITETISEHYTNNVADGLEALKTLDSNNDNQFTSADAKWNDIRVWQDANEDGITDQGELKTLSQLNISAINLSREIAYHERIAGNPVLSRSTYTTANGQIKEAAAVDFTTNPIGYEWNDSYEQGAKITNQDNSSSSFVITDIRGATINLAEKGVNSGYGNIGNDTIIGDAQDNWLMGGQGSDTLRGGAGNDLLMIDAQDENQNVDGGLGLDVVKVIGDDSIVFNLAISNVEVLNSGGGDDVLIGGGTSNVFISGGAGDDIVIGGAADDALSGEDGSDMIDGGYGDDVIRGHRGNDVLIGGEGNDYIEGGLGDDIITGGVGNDVLIGNEGNDQIDGGAGFDMVEYSGKYDQYTFAKNADGTTTVTNTVDGSVDTIKNVERLRFDNVNINISENSNTLPLPVKDNIVVTGNGSFIIEQAQLLTNDFSISGRTFSIKSVSDAVGGAVSLGQDGRITFIPDQNFIGTMSFDYSVIDQDGNYATISRQKLDGTIEQADLKAQVNLTNASDPTDPLYYDQWYLSEIKVKPVWQDYSGKGVSIGVFEGDYGNPLNHRHADLDNNISDDYLSNILIEDDVENYSNHATLVAGVIAAEKNGIGSIGIAYDAKISSLSWDSGVNGLGKLMDYDVANNSWITSQSFGDDFGKNYGNDVSMSQRQMALNNAAEYGRDGLGTSVIFAGGNKRQEGDNVNYHNTQNSRFVITTGSINQEGDLSKLVDASQPFSNPGSAILVSAPGSNIKSTANLLENSNGSTFGSDFKNTEGTSFSAPIVSGIVALMLEANPNLGYRDIQTILARTARIVEDQNTIWKNNGDNNLNSGEGMHYSEDYGFGIVDAHAAVRMAEAWTQINNELNEQSLVISNNNAANILDNASITSSINVNNSTINLEHVEVYVDIDHSRIGDLVLTLISPDGTESILVNRPNKPLNSNDSNFGSTQNGLKFTLSSTHYLGENSAGNWILKVEDKASGVSGILNKWDLKLYGSAKNDDDTYTFTKEFANNKTIADSAGLDSIDATGILTNSIIDLRSGFASNINGHSVTTSSATVIENAYSGDGNDTLIGNATNNILYAGRGDNTITGGLGSDQFVITKNANQTDRITDFNISDANEKIDLSKFNFSSFSDLIITQQGSSAIVNLANGQKLVLENVIANSLNATNFVGFLNDTQQLNGTSEKNNLYGDERNTIINAGAGDDYIDGGTGNNTLTGGDGADKFFIEINPNKTDIITDFNVGNLIGHETEEKISLRNFKNIKNIDDLAISQQGADAIITLAHDQKIILQNVDKNNLSNNNFIFFGEIIGTDGADKMIGSDLPDIMSGGSGNDFMRGLEWKDDISGGQGNDEILGDHGDDILHGDLGNDIILGGIGADTIYGGQDNDILFGGGNGNASDSDNKTNIIYGEGGSDSIYGDAGADKLYGGFGDDDINGGEGDDEIYGDENNDRIYGGGGNDKIFGGDDDDTIDAGSGDDEIHGGAGNDKIDAISGNNLIYGDAGNDLVFGGVGIDRIHGGDGNDTIVGESDNGTSIGAGDFLYGESGNDILLGAAGNDEINGGDGDDVLQGDLGDDQLFGDAGSDVLRGNQGNNILTGGSGNDIFVITDNANGSDIINDFEISNQNEKINLLNLSNVQDFSQLTLTQLGNDTVVHLQNNQEIILKNIIKSSLTRSNFVTSNNAPEVINQVSSKNTFVNTPFSFNIQNSFFDADGDILTYSAKLSDGSSLPSWITFNPSTLTFSGTASPSSFNATIVVTATDSHGASTSTNFIFNTYNGSVINGTPLTDFSVGTSGNDYITGAASGDYLFGGKGNDIMYGGDGNDNIRGDVEATYNPATGVISTFNYNANVGNDTLYGEAGNDTILGDRGNDEIYGGIGNDTLIGCEGNDTIYGGDGDDQIVGGIDSNPNITDYDSDTIRGENGNDTIWGSNGNDIIYGDSGNDFIFGNKGNDIIHDGSGKDVVYGGEGNDIIYIEGENQLTNFSGSINTAFLGEAGNDTFVITKDTSVLAGTAILNDIIYDFEVTNPNEKIDLTAFKNIRDISDLRFSNATLNNVQFLKVYVAGEESDQYLSLRNITQEQLQNSNFIFFSDRAPIAANDSVAVNEDGSILIRASDLIINDSDAEDGAPVFYKINSQPNHGNLVNNQNGTYTYTPTANFNGTDSFSYQVKDSNGAVRSAVVNIAVNSINDIPTATIIAATTNEDSSILIDVLSGANDIDGDILSISGVTNGSHGITSITTDAQGRQQVIYTPNNNYNGTDSFNYTISDGNNGVITKTLNVNIAAINDAPIATLVSSNTSEDNSLIIDVLAAANDIDLDYLLISNITNPSHGTSSIIIDDQGRQKIIYIPASNFFGNDSLDYIIDDGNGGTITKTLNITVNSVNDAPVATLTSAATNEDTDLTIDVLGSSSDADNDTLTISEIGNAAHGNLSVITDTSGKQKILYTPTANFNGEDNFTYKIADGRGGEATQTIHINVASVNDNPVASIATATVNEDNTITIDVLAGASDVDSVDVLSLAGVYGVTNGTANIVDGKIVYTPAANFNGEVSFTYAIADNNGGLTNQTLRINVAAVNDAPISALSTTTVNEDNSIIIDILANASDVDGDQLTIAATTNPSHGKLSVITDSSGRQKILYTPTANFHGEDNFTYTISDGHGEFITQTANIIVNSVNDLPRVKSIAPVILRENKSIILNPLNAATDIDGDTLSISSAILKTTGNIKATLSVITDTGARPKLLYTPNANENGADKIEYTISDGNGGLITKTVDVWIIPVNATINGTAASDSLSGDNANDMINGNDGDDTLLGNAGNDELQGENGADTIIGGAGDDTLTGGADTDRYIFNAGSGQDTIIDNDGLILIDQTASNKAIRGIATRIGNSNDFVLQDQNNAGQQYQLNLIGNTLTIRHHLSDSIIIKNFHDNTFGIDLNYNPTATTLPPIVMRENKSTIIDVLASASDFDGDALSISSAELDIKHDIKATLSVITDSDGIQKLLYTPNANRNGPDRIKYTISDGHGGFVTKIVCVWIIPVNNPINGTAAANTINGNAGNDMIDGKDGNDIINDNAGDDEIHGGNGADQLNGGAGADFIYGENGADRLTGGAGSDQFIYTAITDSTSTTSDLILDFVRGEDKIKLSGLGFSSISQGLGSNGLAHGLEFYFDGNGNTIIDDPNSDFAIKLSGEIALSNSDFIM